jgi:hypothetical protein
MVWKTRLSAISDLTETKRKKNRQETLVFKTTQKLNKIPGTLESLPSMVASSVESPHGSSSKQVQTFQGGWWL